MALTPMQLTFEIFPEQNGGYGARCREADIFTQRETLDEVHRNAIEAVQGRFFDQPDDYFAAFEVVKERVRIPA